MQGAIIFCFLVKSSKLFVCVGFGWVFFFLVQLNGLETGKILPVSPLLYIKPSFFFLCHLIANAERLHQTVLGTVVKAMMVVMLSKKNQSVLI